MNTALPPENADISTAAAAAVILGSVSRQIGTPEMTASATSAAIRPVYGVVRNRTVIDKITTDRINKVLARLRNSALPPTEYHRLTAMLLEAYHSANPPHS